MKECSHCKTPFIPTETEQDFCCSGCRYTNSVLLDEGLEAFYQLRDDKSGRPVGERPFVDLDLSWLEKKIFEAEAESEQCNLKVAVSGITCIGCVWLIERLFMAKQGAVRVNIHPATATAQFVWQRGSTALFELAEELPRYGYLLEEFSFQRSEHMESKKIIGRLGISTAAAVNTMAFTLPRYLGMKESFSFAGIFDLIALFSATVALLVGGSYFFSKAITAIQHRTIHIDIPIALGLFMAYLGSLIGWISNEPELLYFDFVAMFTVFMLIGRYLHLSAAEKAQNQLQGQSAIMSDIQLSNGESKPTLQIVEGDEFFLTGRHALPVASRLSFQGADFSLAWMTGEPEPRSFSSGAVVPAGAVLLSSEKICLRAEENYEGSLVQRLSEEKNEVKGSPWSELVLKIYLVCIVVVGFLAGSVWLALGKTFLESIRVTISILVISCPCAIGVAIPLIDRRAGSLLARFGVFVQNPALWSTLSKVKHLVFDKTGTLTLDTPQLENTEKVLQLEKDAQEALFLLCHKSLHPLSRSLAQLLAGEYMMKMSEELYDFRNHPGLGVEMLWKDKLWTLGKPGWRGQEAFIQQEEQQLACELSCNTIPVATFRFRESFRPQTRLTMQQLQKKFEMHILSGDQSSRVREMGKKLGIPDERSHGGLSPNEKESLVSILQPCLYLGDGMNDSLAFDTASVSGTPVADRSLLDRRADFLFTSSTLSFLPTLFDTADWRKHTVLMVLVFTITYNFVAITACILGHMTPLVAAILMPLSSIVSLLIAQRSLPLSDPFKLYDTKSNSMMIERASKVRC